MARLTAGNESWAPRSAERVNHGSVTLVIASPRPAAPRIEVSGTASLAVRELLHGPRRAGRVVARAHGTIIAEFPRAEREPRVIAVSAQDTVRLPNAIIAEGIAAGNVTDITSVTMVADNTHTPGGTNFTIDANTADTENNANAGGGQICVGQLIVHARRWWDPAPVFGPLSRARLDRGAAILSLVCGQADPGPGLAQHDGPRVLATCCAHGDLASAAEQAERLVGLGPGIIPAGDNVLCGLLLALRLLGGAIPGGTRAVWLADWLSAAVTSYATQRTTPLAASLLHCAARGQAAAEVAAVLRGVAGEDPVEPAARRLLAAGFGSADLAWGLVAGCRAAQMLSVS
jgi:hypothetical protein